MTTPSPAPSPLMTPTMRQNVARALAEADGGLFGYPMRWPDFVSLADAALRALQEPTQAMVAAGVEMTGGEITDAQAASLWRAMVVAALGEGE